MRRVCKREGNEEDHNTLVHTRRRAPPPPHLPRPITTTEPWERLCVERAGASVGGTPRGRSSACEHRDNCPTLTQ